MRAEFVTVQEAAFIAEADARAINRAIDERLLPDELIENRDGRRIAELGAALFRLYIEAESTLSASIRRNAIWVLTTKRGAT